MEIFKQDGLTIWYYTFKYTNDYLYNKGYKQLDGSFTGTKKAYIEWRTSEEWGQGQSTWDVKKRHATKEEYECLKSFWEYFYA